MGTGRASDDADALGVDAALRRFAADDTDGPLSVLPSRFVDRKPGGTRHAIPQPNASYALIAEDFFEPGHHRTVAARIVASAGNENDARAVLLVRSRLLAPFEIRHSVRALVESRFAGVLRGSGILVLAEIRNLAFGPKRNFFRACAYRRDDQSHRRDNLFLHCISSFWNHFELIFLLSLYPPLRTQQLRHTHLSSRAQVPFTSFVGCAISEARQSSRNLS